MRSCASTLSQHGKALHEERGSAADGVAAMLRELFEEVRVTEGRIGGLSGLEDLNQAELLFVAHSYS
jgi:hypothetical protein